MVKEIGLSGVELLALYGEDSGENRKYRSDDSRIALYGESDRIADNDSFPELLGATQKKKKKFLPGLGKGIKSVGKVTSGFTSAAASAVGVPKPLLNALSKVDPTKKNKSATQAVQTFTNETQAATAQKKEIIAVKPESINIDTKKIAIIAGSGIAALVVLKFLFGGSGR